MEIKFGTDGWRAIIARDFTFSNVRIVAQAIADYINNEKELERVKCIVVGYDTRFLSERFAEEITCVLAANNIKVILSHDFLPTPALSYAVISRNADGGIMVTASHNPPAFNGIKFKSANGASAPPETTKQFELNIERIMDQKIEPSIIIIDQGKASDLIEIADLKNSYFDRLRQVVDVELIKSLDAKIIVDPMHGASRTYLLEFLKSLE